MAQKFIFHLLLWGGWTFLEREKIKKKLCVCVSNERTGELRVSVLRGKKGPPVFVCLYFWNMNCDRQHRMLLLCCAVASAASAGKNALMNWTHVAVVVFRVFTVNNTHTHTGAKLNVQVVNMPEHLFWMSFHMYCRLRLFLCVCCCYQSLLREKKERN